MKIFLKYLYSFLHGTLNNNILFSEARKITSFKSLQDISEFEIIVYLPTPPSSIYQLSQWLKPLIELSKSRSIAIITRNINTFAELSETLSFPVIQIQRMNTLRTFYKQKSPKVTLYVNNSLKNNQSLLNRKSYHIHINHGESEKESMSSNQSKAYDYIFTVGQRGVDRYEENLLNFNENSYLKVGRPQLDHIEPTQIEDTKKKILYAPTWEAHFDEMDYCSLEKYGLKLVNDIIKDPGCVLIYKPHPLIGSKRKAVSKIHNKILIMINDSDSHYYSPSNSILDLFDTIDFAFFDNTSVMIDYLFFEKPGAYIEVRKDIKSSKFLDAYYLFNDKKNDINISSFINHCILNDDKKHTRKLTKEHYLGDYKLGESTAKFISTTNFLIKKRDQEIIKFKVNSDA